MQKILISSLVRNNENYLPYLFKCIEQNEEYNCSSYEFEYVFLISNSEDNSLEILKDKKQLYNINIIERNYNQELLNSVNVHRQDLLDEVKKKDFDYLIMIDSDIIFNGKIIEDLIYTYENSEYDVLSTNTNPTNNPFYYGFFSLIDDKGKKPFDNILDTLDFTYKISVSDEEDIVKVKSAFAGMYIISKKILEKKQPNYFSSENNNYEHTNFNQNLDIGIVKNINPLGLKYDNNKSKYARAVQKINNNKSDNRSFVTFFSYLFALSFIAIFSMIYFRKKIYIGLIISIICVLLIVNSFNEFI